MLIPVTHENLRGRRWPYITIAVILINLLAFLGTHWTLQRESQKLAAVKVHILLLAAMHPELQMTPEVQKLVESFQRSNPKLFAQAKLQQRPLADAWDARMRLMEPEQAQEEMNALGQQLVQLHQSSLVERYAFIPSRPQAIAFLTANFLHGGWLHLIFNMWFLWLAGSVLEDTWGRLIYPVFYLVAGAVALVVHAAVFPNSVVPTLGASGAVAGLMGAFLVRFPKTKIQMWWILFLLFRFRIYKFRAPAYTLLPLWLGLELLSGVLFGQGSGVAHWAHIGGFAFGAGMALLLRFSGAEHAAEKAIEAKVAWTADSRIVQASELLAQNQPDAAIAPLKSLLAENPDMLEAHDLLLKVYWRKQDLPAHREELATLCRLHVNAKEMDEAWQKYEEYTGAGGEKLHKAIWMELCRYLESRQDWERAAAEYEKLARMYPSDRVGASALVAAARVQQKQLHNPAEALRLYRAAEASPAPQADLNAAIRAGLQELNAAPAPQPVSR